VAKRNWGSTADWVNASANIAQASAMRQANQTMQQQNALIAEQNSMMKEQSSRVQQIADARRFILEVEHNLPNYVTMAIDFQEYVVCELNILEEQIKTQTACFNEFDDIERTKKLMINLSNMRNTIQDEMNDDQLEVVSFLPTIPHSIARIDEGIQNKKKLERNTRRLEDRMRRHRASKKMSIIPVILMILIVPLTYYFTFPELQDPNVMEVDENKVLFYEADSRFHTTNFSLNDMESFGQDLENFPLIEDWQSSQNDLIDMLKTIQIDQVDQISREDCVWPYYNECRTQGLYFIEGTENYAYYAFQNAGSAELVDVQIDGECAKLLFRHCIIEYSGTWTLIGIDSENRVTEVTQSEVSLKSYLVGYKAKTHPDPEVPASTYLYDETIDYESESYVINYNNTTEEFSIIENDEILQYLESEGYSDLGNGEYDPGFCPLDREVYIDCSLRGRQVFQHRSDNFFTNWSPGNLDTLISSSENNNCENLNEDLLKDDRGFERSSSCSNISVALLSGAPFTLIFIGLYRTPNKVKKLIKSESELTLAISDAGFSDKDKEELVVEKQRLVEYHNYYSPNKI